MKPIQFKKLLALGYYRDIFLGNERFGTFLAILILSLVLSVKPSIYVYTDIYPVVSNLENKITRLIEEVYPPDLEIKITKGIASTNVTEPYYVTARKEEIEDIFSVKRDTNTSFSKVRLLAIDTKGKAEDFEQYQSLALLTENSLVSYRDHKINIYPLRNMEDLTINKKTALEKVKTIIDIYNLNEITSVGVFFLPVFIFLGLIISQYILFFLLSLAVLMMTKIYQQPIGFWRNFSFTVALAFGPVFLWNLLLFIPVIGSQLQFLQSVLAAVILSLAYFVIKRIKES